MLCEASLHRYWTQLFEENPYIYAYILSDYRQGNFNLVKLVFVPRQCVCGTVLLCSFLRGEKSQKEIQLFTQSHVFCFVRANMSLTADSTNWSCFEKAGVQVSYAAATHTPECPAGLRAFLRTKCTKSHHTSLVLMVAQQHLGLRQ